MIREPFTENCDSGRWWLITALTHRENVHFAAGKWISRKPEGEMLPRLSVFYKNSPASGEGCVCASDLDVVLQTPDQLPVHLSSLSHSDAPALSLTKAVLKDATGFFGLFQLQPQLLQLVHLLLLEHVTHLQHLTTKLLHLILVKTAQTFCVKLKGKKMKNVENKTSTFTVYSVSWL